jgi:uncharacterized protein YjbJ (UPF0337 family)
MPGFIPSGESEEGPQRKQGGQWNQTIGATKEAVGGFFGAEQMKQEGREQNIRGQQQEAQGQVKNMVGGVADRVQGSVGSTVAGAMGNKDAQHKFDEQLESGKAALSSEQQNLQREADARRQANVRSSDQ